MLLTGGRGGSTKWGFVKSRVGAIWRVVSKVHTRIHCTNKIQDAVPANNTVREDPVYCTKMLPRTYIYIRELSEGNQ
jgi:hypothetical protein